MDKGFSVNHNDTEGPTRKSIQSIHNTIHLSMVMQDTKAILTFSVDSEFTSFYFNSEIISLNCEFISRNSEKTNLSHNCEIYICNSPLAKPRPP